jgi:hypothetical protein
MNGDTRPDQTTKSVFPTSCSQPDAWWRDQTLASGEAEIPSSPVKASRCGIEQLGGRVAGAMALAALLLGAAGCTGAGARDFLYRPITTRTQMVVFVPSPSPVDLSGLADGTPAVGTIAGTISGPTRAQTAAVTAEAHGPVNPGAVSQPAITPAPAPLLTQPTMIPTTQWVTITNGWEVRPEVAATIRTGGSFVPGWGELVAGSLLTILSAGQWWLNRKTKREAATNEGTAVALVKTIQQLRESLHATEQGRAFDEKVLKPLLVNGKLQAGAEIVDKIEELVEDHTQPISARIDVAEIAKQLQVLLAPATKQ